MSYQIGINTLKLQPGSRCAHTEYCDHYALVRSITGHDPLAEPNAWREFYDAWNIDFIWNTYEGKDGWGKPGRITDMGHAEFMEGGIDRRDSIYCPFKTVDEVWNFDAVAEYGLVNIDELIKDYEANFINGRVTYPNQVFTGGHYDTIVSGAIQAFGWDMLLAAAADWKRFDKVLEGIFQITLHSAKAWSRTSIEVFIQHDDMVWTNGAFMRPEFYRQSIFPRYQKLWQILHDAGKIVLFCSDGNFTQFIDDIAQVGADGFIFEPLTDFNRIVEKYGNSKVIMGSKVDCRTLTFGSRDQIKAEIDETLTIARDCPGFVFAVGNHLPSNIPLDNAHFYFDYLSSQWNR
jgi:hypothetical protein